jgi:hypothetical protein
MTIGSTSVGLGKTSGPKFFIYFSSGFVTSVAPTILSLLSPSDLPPTFAATTMGSCCGPCFTATRLCSSSHEVKMFLLVPSLSPCLLDPTAPTRPHRAQLPHPSTRTSSVMESCVLVVVKATSPPYYRCGRQISFMKKISLQICRGGGGGGGPHLCVTVVSGWAPQRRPDLVFLVEARARRRQWSGRSGVGVAGGEHRGPVAGRLSRRRAGEDRWAGDR